MSFSKFQKRCPVCGKPWETKVQSRFGSNKLLTGKCGHIFNEKQIVNLAEEEFKPERLTEEIVVACIKEACLDLLDVRKDKQELKVLAPSAISETLKRVLRKTNKKSPESIVSVDNKTLYPFQCEVVRQVEQSNVNCLVEFQMGLGKTPITDATFNLHEEILPALIVCKGSIKWQHFKELIRWNGGKKAGAEVNPIHWTAQVIETGNDIVIPAFKVFITSYDLLSSLDPEDFKAMGMKTIVLDECQKISNTKTKRSKSLREFIDAVGIEHIMALSGTPIKNSPVEFFSVLNLIKPDLFPSKKAFERDWVDYRRDKRTGKWKASGIRNIEYFHELTKGFIFRKTREEVKHEIGLSVTEPFRDFKFLDIDKDLKKQYQKQEDEFSEFFLSKELENNNGYSFADYLHILALFVKMRHLAGLSKISWAEEFLSEWLNSRCLTVEELTGGKTIEPKIAIFTHHIDVAEYLMSCVKNLIEVENYDWKPLYLPSGLSSGKQDDIQNEFNFGTSRVLIASTLGSGEGINLQHNCHDAVMMERQWNPANEEQAESRFIRIGQYADLVTVTYPTVLGTIDEYFTELVERKRAMLKEIKSGKKSEQDWDQQETVMSLAQAIIAKRKGIRWTY